MFNRSAQDNCAFDAQTPHCNLTNARNDTRRQTSRRIEMGDSPYYKHKRCVNCNYYLVNMKERFKNFIGGLEKTLESCKTHWKEIVTAIALPFIFNSSVKAGVLNTRCISSLTRPRLSLVHINGATEGYDTSSDAIFLEAPSPTLDIYSKIITNPSPKDRLMLDARPPESTTAVNAEISGRGLGAPTNANLQFSFYDIGEDNFSWKNIIGELSQRVDDGEGGYKYALIGNYDIKNLVNSATTIPISINNGETIGSDFFPSHKLDYSFFNYTDLNRDRQTNGLDFKIFAENYGRNNETDPNTFGDYVGSEPNNFNAYADIDRSGTVGLEDLDIFKSYFKFSGDFNLDGIVNNTDYAYLANDWNVGDANFYDLGAFVGDYLRDINVPSTW